MKSTLRAITLGAFLSIMGQPLLANYQNYWPYFDQAQKTCFQFVDGKIPSLDKLVALGAEKKRVNRKKIKYHKDIDGASRKSSVIIFAIKGKKLNHCEIYTVAKRDIAQALWRSVQKTLDDQGFSFSRKSNYVYHINNGKVRYYIKALLSGGVFTLKISPLPD